jgi:hypothetical protein
MTHIKPFVYSVETPTSNYTKRIHQVTSLHYPTYFVKISHTSVFTSISIPQHNELLDQKICKHL